MSGAASFLCISFELAVVGWIRIESVTPCRIFHNTTTLFYRRAYSPGLSLSFLMPISFHHILLVPLFFLFCSSRVPCVLPVKIVIHFLHYLRKTYTPTVSFLILNLLKNILLTLYTYSYNTILFNTTHGIG